MLDFISKPKVGMYVKVKDSMNWAWFLENFKRLIKNYYNMKVNCQGVQCQLTLKSYYFLKNFGFELEKLNQCPELWTNEINFGKLFLEG